MKALRYGREREKVRAGLDRRIAALAEEREKLAQLVVLDPLTNVLNRRGLEQALAREVGWVRRAAIELAALLIDLDNFKRINEAEGYAAGDAVLKEVAERLRGALRATDGIGRPGGDEFLILLPRTSREQVRVVGERLRLAVARESVRLPSGGAVQVTVSMGAWMIGKEALTLEDVIAHAEGALRESKACGKNALTVAY